MTSIVRQLLSVRVSRLLKCLPPTKEISTTFTRQLLCQRFYSNTLTSYEVIDTRSQKKITEGIIQKVNELVAKKQQGRLFAVVHIAGKQRKVTESDVVIIEGYWPPNIGDTISLDKVLMVGAEDFTLVGRPLVQKGLVNVEATVIEKTLSHTKTNFKKKRRKQFMRIHFYKIPQTYLRINKVEIKWELNNPPDVQGLETAVF